MAIMNADKTTSQLSIMPDPALKQMAMMHKNDPYMLSLIIAEDGRRKEMRTAAMARMAGGPQPTIADQSISQMGQMPQQPMPPQAPQQQMPPQGMPQQAPQQPSPQAGIPALPAQNVQGMAGGGIVALADGGMPDYGDMPVDGGLPNYGGMPDDGGLPNYGGMTNTQLVSSNEPVVRMAKGGDPEDQYIVSPDDMDGTSGDVYSASGELLSSGDTSTPKTVEQEWKEKYLKQKTKTPEVAPEVAAAVKDKVTDKKAPPPSAKNKVIVTPPAALTKDSGGIQDLTTKFGGTTTESIARDMLASQKQSDDETEKFYRPEREKLQQEKEAIANRGNSNFGNAMLRAGLGMMGGKSQYAMQNIAEGATQGLNAYQEAQKYDNAAQQANQHSQMLMMQAERSERIGNKREAIAASNQARQFQQAAATIGLHAQQIKGTEAFQQGQLEVLRKNADTNAKRASNAEDLSGFRETGQKLSSLKAQLADANKRLAGTLRLADKVGIQAEIASIKARMNGLFDEDTDGTIPAVPSPSAGGGVDQAAVARALAKYK